MSQEAQPTYSCLGTRMMVLTSEKGDTNSSNPREGLLTVYQRQGDIEDQDVLIRLGTSVASYQGKIPFCEVKLPADQKKNIPQFLLQDRSHHENILVSLNFDNETPANLKLVIQQRIQQWGTLKFLFQDTLKKEGSLLRFCSKLGDTINDGQTKINRLSTELASAEHNVSIWKTTAQELETKSREEKQKILQSTLLAWQENQKRHKDRIEDLTEQLSQAQHRLQQSKSSTNSRRTLLDAPDDLDAIIKEEPMAESAIQALATGRRVNTANRASILDPSETLNKADLKRDRKEYSKEKKIQRRTKKIPPKKETDNEDSSPSRTQPKPAKRQRKFKKSEESSSSDTSVVANEEEGQNSHNSEDERMRMAIRSSVQSSRLDDDSDTDLSG